MLMMLAVLLLAGVTLGVLFYAATLFLQGYFYTQPTDELFWKAPAAAAALTLFWLVWCMMIVFSSTATPTDIPYNTLFVFSAEERMVNEPVKELWAVKKDGKVKYVSRRLGQTDYEYRDTTYSEKPWNGTGVQKIIVPTAAGEVTFEAQPDERGAYREFLDKTSGWTMVEFDKGPSGRPTAFRWSKFLINAILNLGHLLLWIACMWLILRFLLSHAILLGFGLWLLVTLAVMPMLLGYAAEVSQARRSPAPMAVSRPARYSEPIAYVAVTASRSAPSTSRRG